MADARYVIDVAAQMSGTETLSELDSLADKLAVGGRKSEDFQQAIKRVTADLDAAKTAASQAAAALAVGNDEYRVLERAATSAAKAVERANAKGRIDLGAAREAGLAQAKLDAYSVSLRGLEQASAAASAKQAALAKQVANVSKLGAHADARFQATNQRLEKLGAAVGRLPGPLGSIGSRLVGAAKAGNELSGALGGVSLATIAAAAGVALVAVAVAAVTVALIAGAVAAVNFAVSQADAARQAALSREAFAALSAETAAGVSAFSAIAQETGLADAELAALTKQLRAAEVSAADMPKALRAAALAERALGKGGAGDFISRIQAGELAVADFARTAEDSFGGIVAEQMRGLDAQMTKLSKAWGRLFAGVNLDPFLDALAVIVGMFDRGHPLAQAFGAGVEAAINPIGPLALKAAYAVEAFALGFAIQLTKLYLFVKPALKWLGELFGFSDTSTSDMLLSLAETAGKVLVPVLLLVAGAFSAVVGVFAVLSAAVGAMVFGPLTLLITTLYGLWELGGLLVDVGANLMRGLVDGITGAVGSVISAVTSAVTAAIDAAKSVLGIASPSKVFAEIGGYTVEGFTGSVDDGAVEAQGSMAALVDPGPVVAEAGSAAAAPSGAGASAGGSKSIDMAGATFNFYGVKDAETHGRSMIAEALTELLDGDADSMAGAEA
jgi:hypothetical protein